ISVGDKYFLVAHRFQLAPTLPLREERHVLHGALNVETTWCHHYHIGICLHELLPTNRRGMFSLAAKNIGTTGDINQSRHPIAPGHEPIDPFDKSHARAA